MPGYSKLTPLAYGALTGAANTLVLPRFDPENWLLVLVRIAGYGGSAIAQLQFNGDTGTTAYAWRVSNNGAASTTAVAGVANGIKVSQTATVNPRALLTFNIGNVNGRAHGVVYEGCDLSESAATAPDIVQGAGIWTTTSQINQITLDGGGQTLLAGTDMAVWGMGGLL
jgi:hypothetical protein